MRKLTFAAPVALAVAALFATPAVAAPSWHNAQEIRRDISQLDSRIDRALRNRTISHAEAQRLQRNVDQIQRLYGIYARNGLSQAEIRSLETRIDRVQRQLRDDRRNWNGQNRNGSNWNGYRR